MASPAVNVTLDLNKLIDQTRPALNWLVKKFSKKLIYKNNTLQDLNKKCIILIGECGAGKTSFLDLFLNYIVFNDFKYSKFVSKINVTHERGGSSPVTIKTKDQQTTALTTTANMYTINISEGHKFYIIDTPGLNDVGGVYEDEKHLHSIYERLKDMEAQDVVLTSIYFFYNGEKSKISDIENYVLESFKIFFPERANIYFVATKKNDRTSLPSIGNEAVLTLNNPYVLNHILKERERLGSESYNEKNELKEDADTIEPFYDYTKLNDAYKHMIEVNQSNFLNILSTIVCSTVNHVAVKDMLQNYELYSEIKKQLESLIVIFEEAFVKYDFLYHFYSQNNTHIDVLADMMKIIANHSDVVKDQSFFLQHNNQTFDIFCRRCGLGVHIRTQYVSSLLGSGGTFQVSPTCSHTYPTDFLFIINDQKGKIVASVVRQLVRRSQNVSDVWALMEKQYDACIGKIDTILEHGKLSQIKSLIETLQKRTMISNFEEFIQTKIQYLQKHDLLFETNSMFTPLQKAYIQKYQRVIEILYNNGFETLYKKYRIILVLKKCDDQR